jgi:hypothetical protein
VTSHLESSGHVDSVQCRFCVIFGRKAKVAAKFRVTENPKFFTHPFPPDSYVAFLKSTPGARWEEYFKLSDIEKDTYVFNCACCEHDTGPSRHNYAAMFIIDGVIVDRVIGNLLIDGDDDAVTRAFKLVDAAMASLRVSSRQSHVEANKICQYLLCVGYVGHSCSSSSFDATFDK